MERLYRIINIINSSFRVVLSFKIRTFFCLLSVTLAITAITIIVASVEGAYKKAFDLIERFGPDSILILSGSDELRAAGLRPLTLTLEDVRAIQDAFPQAYLVVPQRSRMDVMVSYRGKKYETRVIGSTANYSVNWTWPVIEGADFIEEDVKGLKNLCLLGRHVSTMLFEDISPVGKFIQVDKLLCQVIGVLSERGVSQIGVNLDDRIIMPISTVMKKLLHDPRYVSSIRVRFSDREKMGQWIEELRAFLRERHGLQSGQNDDFRFITPDSIVQFLVALTGSLVVFLGVTGILALLVSGFVLANLFLLSVKERTREIGIRRASGARKKDILCQFLAESLTITIAGGFTGFLSGMGCAKLLVAIADFPIHFSWKSFLIGLLLSILVGVLFGLQPARKASNLNPIEAIR